MEKNDSVLICKRSTFIDKKVKIGQNVIIYENNRIEGDSVIEDNVTIFPNSFIVNSIIGKGSKIYSSYIENSKLGERCHILPFCCLKRVSVESGVAIPSFSEFKQKNITRESIKKKINK